MQIAISGWRILSNGLSYSPSSIAILVASYENSQMPRICVNQSVRNLTLKILS